MRKRTVLIALGGNALSPGASKGTITEQFAHTRDSLKVVMPFIKEGCNLAITHGNGPQVGDELLRVEMAAPRVPPLPLGVCVAATQGTIGYMIEQSLQNALVDAEINREVVSLVTQVIVDSTDPALQESTKFIGHKYTRDQAANLAKRFNWEIGEQEPGIWRRVVPSPKPHKLINGTSIRHLVEKGSIVIAAGGGGIPAYTMENGHYEGIDAVVDKDLTAAVLAQDIRARELYILTDVPCVYLHFKTPHQTSLGKINRTEAQRYLDDGEFHEGSMEPKIQSAIEFLDGGGETVIITSVPEFERALTGASGTLIVNG